MEHAWGGISDKCWKDIGGCLPPRRPPFRKAKRRGGRPRASDKKAFEALIWTLRAGATLERLPTRFGYRRTAFRRLGEWFANASLERLWGYYLHSLSPSELEEWGYHLTRRARRTFWQDMLITSYRMRFGISPRRLATGPEETGDVASCGQPQAF